MFRTVIGRMKISSEDKGQRFVIHHNGGMKKNVFSYATSEDKAARFKIACEIANPSCHAWIIDRKNP
jgi:hypothetical protein